MSGKDEQIIKDYPICPICKDRSAWWDGKKGHDTLMHFNSDYYVGGPYHWPKINNKSSYSTLHGLNIIEIITCNRCNERVSELLKNRIITVAKKILIKEMKGI